MEKIYCINNNVLSNELCSYEMECIFGEYNKFIVTSLDIPVNKSPFIKGKINVLYRANSIEELICNIKEENYYFGLFKLIFVENKDEITEYSNKINILKCISEIMNGTGEFKNPESLIGVIQIEGVWYLGEYQKNDYIWRINNNKPYSYSNAMSADLSRSIVNIAIAIGKKKTIIDPCCGVGTVVIDALMQGICISAVEINKQIGEKAQKNIDFLGLSGNIIIGDMLEIRESYEVSILDIPYGIMSHTDEKLQYQLISKCHEISNVLILVASEDMGKMLKEAGFSNLKQITIKKHNNASFNRHIFICKKNKKKNT